MNRMMLLSTALAVALSGTAAAQSQRYAHVVDSSPIVDRVVQREEVCWPKDGRRDRGVEGAVLGAIVGGALGNQVGKGDGRKAATVAGAVAGAVVGRNIDRRDRDRYRCEWRNVPRETVIGYDVTYRYRGRDYVGQIPYAPGKRIPVIVYESRWGRDRVEPADRLM